MKRTTNRRSRSVRQERITPFAGLRKAITRHLKKYVLVYAPLLCPLLFFLLAHGMTITMLILIKSGLFQQGNILYKTLATWAFYGFLPLLLCSYGCFFAVARPVAGIIERSLPHLSPSMRNQAIASSYGIALVLTLLLLLGFGTLVHALLLIVIGMASGQGTWLFYRTLTVPKEDA
jgi:hypothetical protein